MADQVFPKGIGVFPKHDKAPDFVKGAIVITLNELVTFCKENPGLLTEYKGEKQLKLQLTERKDGKGLNLTVDTYKPQEKTFVEKQDDASLPF